MKPQRMRMTHELIKAYELDKWMDVYVSWVPCRLPVEAQQCIIAQAPTEHLQLYIGQVHFIPGLPCICPLLCIKYCLAPAAASAELGPAQNLQDPCRQPDRCCLQLQKGSHSLTTCSCCCCAPTA